MHLAGAGRDDVNQFPIQLAKVHRPSADTLQRDRLLWLAA
jgi:hypothetical protein